MIHFSKVRYKNLLSTGNAWTEIQLDRDKSTLIIGDNGAGKSTMLDAICFALYGKPFRKINKPQLMNSINKKGLEVELEFSNKGIHYIIRRGIKPSVFEIYSDGELLNQDAASRDYQAYLEDTILKLSYKSFGQVVVLGSSTFIPFMQLSAKDRREVIEDLLDIQIFTTMNVLLKDHVAMNKNSIQDNKHSIDILENQIESAKAHNDSIRKIHEVKLDDLKEKIRNQIIYVEEQKDLCEKIDTEIKDLIDSVSDKDSVKKKLKELQKVDQDLKARLRALVKNIAFYQDHDECPTCQQEIDSHFKQNHIDVHHKKQKQIDDACEQLQIKTDKLAERADEISDTEDAITSKHLERSECVANEKFAMNVMKGIKSEVDSVEKEIEGFDTTKITAMVDELGSKVEDQQRLMDRREMLSIVSVMLKDGGIKTRIIKQYVPIMNTLINKYLAAMDFFVQFELDENFNETIKSRFRDEFSYASFSEGEKLRIDLSLMFTWRAVSKLRNSVSTNLLVMDEIMDSSLDGAGTEEFLKIINDLTADSNIFIISHKSEQLYEKFEKTLKFEKVKNFSRLVA
jgi:DNA repair exonuclease SbcCD ATPase subunit